MTTRELIAALAGNAQFWLPLLLAVPVVAFVLGFAHRRGKGHFTKWRYLYSVLVYAACVPGIAATLLCGYTVAFTHENLLDASATVYLVPLVVMVATLAVVGRQASFTELPGVDRLTGLVLLMVLTGICVLAIARTQVFWVFHGGPGLLAVVAVVLFVGFKVGARMLFGKTS